MIFFKLYNSKRQEIRNSYFVFTFKSQIIYGKDFNFKETNHLND